MTTPDTYSHHAALAAVCKRSRAHTHVHHVYEVAGVVYATIVNESEDPRNLSLRFAKIGYNVTEIHHLGMDWFQYVMRVGGK